MANTRRKTRRIRGGELSNANVERQMRAEKEKIKPPEAKPQVLAKAKARAYKRWDYGALSKKEDKLILSIKQAGDELKEIAGKKDRIVNEEFIKEAADWERQSTRKRGWW